MLNEKTLDKFNELFDSLVPPSGSCGTLGGELLRAVNRVCYRWYNDGDRVWVGYGRETVNPAVRFLETLVEESERTGAFTLAEMFKHYVEELYEHEPRSFSDTDEKYDELVDGLAEYAMVSIEMYKLGDIENTFGDMFDYADPKEDVDRDDDWDDEEDEWEDPCAYSDDDYDDDEDEEDYDEE
ncbi:MAG: hypothetical protein IJG38_01885 [Thermoguttaceae bacterium]|nr:hypothetical protein [Thermoguttaceae bacterium]